MTDHNRFEPDGEWVQCETSGPKPQPDVCPSGTWRIISDCPDVHFHWQKKRIEATEPVETPEVYLWEGCVAVIDSRREIKETARVFLYQPSTGKMWWKRYPYPLPDTALRIDPDADAHAESYKSGFDAGYVTAWPSRSETVEVLLTDEKGEPTAGLYLDDSGTHDAARLVKIAEILGIGTTT